MADASSALRLAILAVGWPGMALVSGTVLWSAVRFHQRVQGSPFGRLVLLMVVGWVLTMGFLAFLATLYLQSDPAGAAPLAAAFLAFWAATMSLITWLVHRWGAEAVAINLYYAELAAMDRVRGQFVNTVAHELATPLTPLLLKMQVLRSARFGPLTPGQGEVLDSMERNLGRLQALVEQVVLATQVQAGRLPLIPLPTPADEWVRAVAARFAPQAVQEGRRYEVHAETGATAVLDQARMDRALSNLLENAFRHATGSPIQVRAAVRGGLLRLEVSDGGPGFTPEQAARLFQPFRHARDPQEDTQAGAGLGLYIARGIVEAHGGRVLAESPGPGQGATFRLEVPLAGPPPPADLPTR